MSTPRDLMRSTWERQAELIMLRAPLEDYILFTVAKLCSFLIGIGSGFWIWGV